MFFDLEAGFGYRGPGFNNIRESSACITHTLKYSGFPGDFNSFRFKSPTRITAFDDSAILVINDALQDIWDLSNGRFSPNTGTAASTGTGTVKMGSVNNANSAGWIKFEKSDGTVIYVPYWSDDTP